MLKNKSVLSIFEACVYVRAFCGVLPFGGAAGPKTARRVPDGHCA